MKYSVKREGRTVCIGQCDTFDEVNEMTLNRAVREIGRRLRTRNVSGEVDNGVTYRKPGFGDLVEGDKIALYAADQVVTVTYGVPVSEAASRPRTITD